MPKYYCEYCGCFLNQSSPRGRREHSKGMKHIQNKINFYTELLITSQREIAYQQFVDARQARKQTGKTGPGFVELPGIKPALPAVDEGEEDIMKIINGSG